MLINRKIIISTSFICVFLWMNDKTIGIHHPKLTFLYSLSLESFCNVTPVMLMILYSSVVMDNHLHNTSILLLIVKK